MISSRRWIDLVVHRNVSKVDAPGIEPQISYFKWDSLSTGNIVEFWHWIIDFQNSIIYITRGRWKVLGLVYVKLRRSGHLVRDPDGSWCHRHTTVKLSWSQPMDPWTEWKHTRVLPSMSMEPSAATKKALHYCEGDTSSCPGSYLTAVCSEFHIGWRLGFPIHQSET